MTAFDLRALAASDLEAAGRLLVAAHPHREDEVVGWSRDIAGSRVRRWVAVARDPDAAIVGYAALWNVRLAKWRMDVVVHADRRRGGIGTALLDTVVAQAVHHDAQSLQARPGANCPAALAFLERRCFVETMRMHWSDLDVSALDAATLDAWATRESMDGIVIASVAGADLGDSNAAFWQQMCNLHEAAAVDWPDPDPGGPTLPHSPVDLRAMLLGNPAQEPVAFCVARRGDALVGYSVLSRLSRRRGEAQFAGTAVRPDVRGRGIATALRARCLSAARAAEFLTVRSASGNAALLRINARFGFVETYCEVRLVWSLATTVASRTDSNATPRDDP